MTAVAKQEKFDIKKLNNNKLLNVDEGRKNQLKLVEDNPYTEITNNQTYLLAKMRRTGLLKGRTGIQGVEKTMVTQIGRFRRYIGDIASELVDVTIEAEKKQQAEINRWEVIRAEKRVEREKKEAERKLAHTTAINAFEETWVTTIADVKFKDISELDDIKTKIMAVTGEFEEFNGAFDGMKIALVGAAEAHHEGLQLIEDKRIIEVEKADLKKKKEVQDAIDLKAAEKFAKEKAEKKRVRLLPDKERLIETLTGLNLPEIEKFKEKEAQQILAAFEKDFKKLKKTYITMAEKTL